MFIKYKLRKLAGIFLAAFAILTLCYCAQENASYHKVPKFESKQQCLNKNSSRFQKFMNQQISSAELKAFWSCNSLVLKEFMSEVEGEKDRNAYSAEELKTFIEDIFFKERGLISDKLLASAMDLKKLFLGGNGRYITRLELKQTIDLINNDFLPMTEAVRPYMSYYLGDAVVDHQMTQAEFNKISLGLEKFFKRLTRLILWNEPTYSFSSLQSLVEELHLFFKKQNSNYFAKNYSDYITVLSKVKGVALGSGSESISVKEWGPFLQISQKSVDLYLRYKYFVKPDWASVKGVSQLNYIVDSVGEILKQSLAFQERPDLRPEDTKDLFRSLAAANLLPLSFKFDDFYQLWSVALSKFIPVVRTDEVKGFTLDDYKYLKEEWQRFLAIQELLNGSRESAIGESFDEFVRATDTPWPYIMDQNGRVVFDRDSIQRNPNKESLQQLNWERVVVRNVIKTYAKNKKRKEDLGGLTENELQSAYLDLLPLLATLGLVDRDDKTFYQRVYQEANLFMPRSNGDRYINFEEGVDYIHFVFSGIDAGGVAVEAASAECPLYNLGEVINRDCFDQWRLKNYASSLSHMKEFSNYYNTLSKQQKKKLILSVDGVVRDDLSQTDFMVSDAKEGYVFVQYIETIMFRFDEDRSGGLNLKEAMKAFPLFAPTLSSLLGVDLSNPDEYGYLEALFTFMLKHGRSPSLEQPVDSLRFLHWRWHKQKWNLEAKRSDIIKVLSSLKTL